MSQDPNIIYVGDLNEDVERGGLGKWLFTKMKEYGDSIAQIDTETGEEDTFASYLQRCIRTAIRMRKIGVQRKDIVALFDYNHLNTSVPMMSALFLGCTFAAADPKLTLKEAAHLLKQLNARMIFTSPKSEEIMVQALEQSQVKTQIVVFGKSKFGNTEFDEFLLAPSPDEEASFRPVEIENLEEEIAVILFSSGSTGYPKGISLSHFVVMVQLEDLIKTIAVKGARFLHFASIYWITKLYFTFLGTLSNYPILIVSEFEENNAWRVITEFQANAVFLSPSFALRLFRGDRPPGADDSSLKLVIVAGNKISEQQMAELRASLPNAILMQAWAMTETAGRPITFVPRTVPTVPAEKVNRAIGRASPGTYYKIVDLETGKSLGPNQPGELRLKSKIQMSGYFGMDSSDAWDEDGYLKSGDLMYYDEDNYFYCVERIGETFKYRSDYVYPNLFEEAFLSHPAVRTVIVVGVPHPFDGMRIAAMVTLFKNQNGVNAETLRKHVEEKTGGRIPVSGGIMIVDEIPEVTSGKARRRAVKDMLISSNNHA